MIPVTVMQQTKDGLRKALILGASGLVGGHCLQFLLTDSLYDDITVLVRKPLPVEHPKLKQHVIDFEQLSSYQDLFNVNDVFCCLGIKGAASAYEFKQVEFTYPLKAGKISSAMGVNQFLIVTAMMCGPRSPIALFRYKGKLEVELKKESLNALHFFRPSLIVGNRKIPRPDEEAIAVFFKKMTIFTPFLRKYLYVEGKDIAFSMVQVAKKNLTGLNVFNVNKIQNISIQLLR